jgi:cell division protein FtsB
MSGQPHTLGSGGISSEAQDLQEELAMRIQQIERLEEENRRLRDENAALKAENRKLRNENMLGGGHDE